jgi:hypothetical protein
MAKGTGIYGNFNGKIGNTVGFKIAQSRNRQNQGVRIYQPSVSNPKTAAQAEQRARVAAVQGTYTLLRNIIDRGNERQPYGYASRVAWLRQAYRSEIFPWYQKGVGIAYPVICPLTFGTLPNINYSVLEDGLEMYIDGINDGTEVNSSDQLSGWLKSAYPFIKDGDQVTFVSINLDELPTKWNIVSVIIDENRQDPLNGFYSGKDSILWTPSGAYGISSVIISRESANGQHLRSTSSLKMVDYYSSNPPYDAASKTAAIASYQRAGEANSDWAEDATI